MVDQVPPCLTHIATPLRHSATRSVLLLLFRPAGKRATVPVLSGASNVVVVGGTDGIGLELVLQCVANAEAVQTPGTVVIVGRKSLDELFAKFRTDPAVCALFAKCKAPASISGPHLDVRYVQVDVSLPNCGVVLAELLQGIPVDVLVYAAADGWVGPLLRETEESIRKTVATNFTGFALIAKHIIRAMLATEKGGAKTSAANHSASKTKKVVVLSSVQSTRPTPMFATYTATKAAIDSFVWSLSTELAGTMVRLFLRFVVVFFFYA